MEPAAHQPKPSDNRFFVRGEIDTTNAAEFQVDLDDEIGTSVDDLVIDCSELAFIDSSGLVVLLRTQQTLRELGRNLRIVNANHATARVMALMGLIGQPNDDDR